MKRITERLDPILDSEASLIERMLEKSDRVFIKKLSNNDRDWAVRDNKHQAGVYVPAPQRDSGFFPPLSVKERDPAKPDSPEIRESLFKTEWPQCGESTTDLPQP